MGHWVTARLFHIDARMIIPYQRFIPMYGWVWNLFQSHELMMCEYDHAALDKASPTVRVFTGFAGPYLQLIFIILIGTTVMPQIGALFGGWTVYALFMCVWQFLYFMWYAIHFHNDTFSDFALFVSTDLTKVCCSDDSDSCV